MNLKLHKKCTSLYLLIIELKNKVNKYYKNIEKYEELIIKNTSQIQNLEQKLNKMMESLLTLDKN